MLEPVFAATVMLLGMLMPRRLRLRVRLVVQTICTAVGAGEWVLWAGDLRFRHAMDVALSGQFRLAVSIVLAWLVFLIAWSELGRFIVNRCAINART